MKDSYSFDMDAAGLDVAYEKHYDAYCRIFDRCGLKYIAVEAHSGAMGGSQSHEFMVASDAGEDFVVDMHRSAATRRIWRRRCRVPVPPAFPIPKAIWRPKNSTRPDRKTIADVAEFTGLPETSQMKSLVMVADGKPVLALLRGDHQLSETKFARRLGATEVRPAHPEEIREWFGAEAGFARTRRRQEYAHSRGPCAAGPPQHDRGREQGRLPPAERHAGRGLPAGVLRPAPGGGRRYVRRTAATPLEIVKTVEIGHIFKLGYKYSESMGLRVLNETGEEITPIMGSYGIGIERILCAAIELYHDKDGMSLPPSIAPFRWWSRR